MKTIDILRARQLQENCNLFTSEFNANLIMEIEWELTDENGETHPDSDKLKQAVIQYHESRKLINNILKVKK